ncbi:MAG: tetratricopeptide repeat protein [Burkholderiales bacterium]|jgi:tetratricopeptide (TPR) repeat protein|nr:tetratricopeptide repeat protein [Burkholderiales bacterium]
MKKIFVFLIMLALSACSFGGNANHSEGKRCGAIRDSGDLDGALLCFNELAKTDQDNARVYVSIGGVYLRKEEYSKAAENFSRAIKLEKNRDKLASLYGLRGMAYYNNSSYSEAVADFTESLKINPSDAEYFSLRSASYLRLKNYERAIDDITQAIKLDSKDVAQFYFERCATYVLMDKYEDALPDCAKSVEIDPNDKDAQWVLEQLRSKNADYATIKKEVLTQIK